MMRAVAKIDDKQVSEMDLDITFRMKVSEWRRMAEQTHAGAYPSWQIGAHIQRVLGHVDKSTSATFTDPLHEADKP